MREITCAHCGQKKVRPTGEVNRSIKAGRPLYCSRACFGAAHKERTKALPPLGPCSVDGCETVVRSRGCEYCETHYYQIRRNGYLGPRQWPEKIDHSEGYQLLWAPDHRLSTPRQKGQRIYEHRAVFYAHHGEGPFTCYFCGTERDWVDTQVARLDGDKENNHIDNLVASCHGCHAKLWHNKTVQTRRRRYSPVVTWQGKTQTICDWADELGFEKWLLNRRYKAGWSVEEMLTKRTVKSGLP